MLSRVDVLRFDSAVLSLSLGDTSNGYEVREIDGLDPVNAQITSQSYAQMDGVQIQSTRRDSRNITIKLGFAPDYVLNSVGSLKAALFAYFLPKTTVTLSFYVNGVLANVISGTVESCANSPFSADPEVNISIICPNPDFSGAAMINGGGTTVTDTTASAIEYDGTSETGIMFEFTTDTALSGFTVHNTRPDNVIQTFDVTVSMVVGDTVTISSIAGSKYARKNHAGTVTSILSGVVLPIGWPSLRKGSNLFRVNAATAGIAYTWSYTPKYAALST